MRSSDLELIAALVEGRLDDENEARALVNSSPAHREEYESQKFAYETLSTLPNASMSQQEKAALHRDVWTALQSPKAATKTSTPWYIRWSYVAAGVLIVVGAAGVITQSSNDSPVTALDAAADDAGGGTEEATQGATQEPDASEAAPEDGADIQKAPPTDPAERFFFDQAAAARAGSFSTLSSSDAQSLEETDSACVDRSGLEDYMPITHLEIEDPEAFGLDPASEYLLAVPEGAELDSTTPVAFVEIGTCLLAHIDE